MPGAVPSSVLLARGSLALEERLLGEIQPLLAEGGLAALARPLRIVVSSRSLRAHLARRLVRRFGALAGVKVQTLHALALEIVEAVADAPPPGDLLFPIVVRECAREEPLLRERLDGLVDGYGIVEASVADLLDAGFEPAHAEAAEEALRDATPAGEPRERGLAVLRVAARTAATLTRIGVGHRSLLYRAAREHLEHDPDAALPSRALFVYGFADATGVQTDLLEALLRLRGARVLLDRPPDPGEPDAPDAGAAFGERFARRLQGACARSEEDATPPPLPAVHVLHAPGVHAEVRCVAERVRSLLDGGVEPEDIAVVARQLAPYRVAVRLHFRRLGIPLSGVGQAGPSGPAARRVAALLALLRLGERLPAERWLDALERLPGDRGPLSAGRRADLLLGLHTLGAARLGEVAALEGGEDVKLPVRLGLPPPGSEARRAPRRTLGRTVLDAAIAAARDLVARLAAWPEREALGARLERLGDLAARDLGWRDDTPGQPELRAALFEAGGALPVDPELDADDFVLFAERSAAGAADGPLGGKGAGVQVLDVMEARGRGFSRLFALGLSRDAFPRVISEDPLLPDRVRRRLRDVLESLPVKADGHDEERFLFAQLVASAPHVTLSAPVSDEDGKARPVSPLLERLRRAPHVPEPELVPTLYAPPAAGAPPRLRPAHEHALLAGLYARRDRFERVLALALDESARERGVAGSVDPAALARARVAVLAELDPSLRTARRLGPYYGFVGPPHERDPRRADVYVTAVEQVARCPWQGFLERLLRVEPAPDPHGELPSADRAGAARLLGALVHRVLERIVRRSLGDGADEPALEDAVRRAPRPIAWPEAADLDALVAGCARDLVREEGIGLPGYARLLALLAREPLAEARDLDWPDGRDGFGALGAEVEGRVELEPGRVLHFKADRVDGDGTVLRLVDYKTGRPPAGQKRPETRRAHFRERVERGDALQAVAYARAGVAWGAGAEGRYVYLKSSDDWPQRIFAAGADDEELGGAFDRAVGSVFDAYEHGAFVPRLFEAGKDDEHHACERCGVKEACLRGDSGARRRLAAWVEAQAGASPDDPLSPAERALLAVWRLHERTA